MPTSAQLQFQDVETLSEWAQKHNLLVSPEWKPVREGPYISLWAAVRSEEGEMIMSTSQGFDGLKDFLVTMWKELGTSRWDARALGGAVVCFQWNHAGQELSRKTPPLKAVPYACVESGDPECGPQATQPQATKPETAQPQATKPETTQPLDSHPLSIRKK